MITDSYIQGLEARLSSLQKDIDSLSRQQGPYRTKATIPLLIGDTAANGDITIRGTSHATKTTSSVLLQDDGGNVGVRTTAPANIVHIADSTAVVGQTQLTIEGRYNGYGTGIDFGSRTSSGGTLVSMGKINVDGENSWNTTASTQDAYMSFWIALNGTLTERVRILSTGEVGIGAASESGITLKLYNATSTYLNLDNSGGGLGVGMQYRNAGTLVGFMGNYSAVNGGALNNSLDIYSANKFVMQLGGNLKISDLTSAGLAVRSTTEGQAHIDIFNGTAPAGTLTNGVSLYSVAGKLWAMDAAGTATKLTP